MTINTTLGNDRFKIVAYLTEDRKRAISFDVFIYQNKGWRKYPVGGSLKNHCEKLVKREIEVKYGQR